MKARRKPKSRAFVPLWYDGILLRPVGLPILVAFIVAPLDKRLAGSEDRLGPTHPTYIKTSSSWYSCADSRIGT